MRRWLGAEAYRHQCSRSRHFSKSLPGFTWILFSKVFLGRRHILEVLPSQTLSWSLFLDLPGYCSRECSSVADTLLEGLPSQALSWRLFLGPPGYCSRECSSVADTLLEGLLSQTLSWRLFLGPPGYCSRKCFVLANVLRSQTLFWRFFGLRHSPVGCLGPPGY